jgi:thioredoxin-related protein
VEMKERVFYVGLVIVQFFLIFFVLNQTRVRSKDMSARLSFESIPVSIAGRLYSFDGINWTGTVENVGFTAYSDNMYLFLVASDECSHCNSFLENFSEDLNEMPLDQAVKLLAVTSGNLEHFIQYPKIPLLRISEDDIQQFGGEVPAVFLVNGQGNILFRSVGYRKNLLENIATAILKSKTRNSETLN